MLPHNRGIYFSHEFDRRDTKNDLLFCEFGNKNHYATKNTAVIDEGLPCYNFYSHNFVYRQAIIPTTQLTN